MFFATLGVVASSIERVATESAICSAPKCSRPRNIFRPDRRAARRCRTSATRCSPRTSPASRVVRGSVTPALENVALWHERDISHSSVERFIGPDATITLDFALARLTERHRQAPRLSRAHAEEPRPDGRPRPFAAGAAGADAGRPEPRGMLCAGPAQCDEGVGIGRPVVAARPAQGRSRSFAASVGRELDALFDLDYHLERVDAIFERVFGARPNHFAKHKFSCALRKITGYLYPHEPQPGG